MYKENILNEKNSECVRLWNEWHDLFLDPDKRFTEECNLLRKRWCNCCDEMGDLLSLEVKTNPKYDEVRRNI